MRIVLNNVMGSGRLSGLSACLLFLALGLAPARSPAAESFLLPVPLPADTKASAEAGAAGLGVLEQSAAERALATGFPSVAADLFRKLLESAGAQGLDTDRLRLSLADALLEDGDASGAREALDAVRGLRSPAWRLRSALVNLSLRGTAGLSAELEGLTAEVLPEADRGWLYWAQGLLADTAGQIDQGRDFYERAVASAATEPARTRFLLARERAFLRRGAGNLDSLRANAQRYAGQKLGFASSKLLAAGLAAAGRGAEAVQVLSDLLRGLPSTEFAELDEVRLLMGLIGGAGQGSAGRPPLLTLLQSGRDPMRQRIALRLLAQASAPGGVQGSNEFIRLLDTLSGAGSQHPILEDLLLARAEWHLAAGDLGEASASARSLLDRFPASPLRLHALGVLVNASWYGGRFLLAADYATRMRELAVPGPLQSRLGVLVAEAWYRAGNYRNAADAYAAVLRDPPRDIAPGVLLFQRIQSEIDAGGSLAAAETLMDQLASEPAFDPASRWQAEWNLARALQAADRFRSAYDRCDRLLTGDAAGIEPPLRARLGWLRARLALDAGLNERALEHARLLGDEAAALAEPLRGQISALSGLIAAQAEFALDQADAALASLERLRTAFPDTDAAVYSIMAEADYWLGREQVVRAQSRLRDLADTYPNSSYAPYALYRAALLAEQRGQESGYREANDLIEQLVKAYPDSALVFHARLRQGSLLSRLNEFASAERTYESLLHQYPAHADILSARMALADCHSAQMGASPSHMDRALELYEGLAGHPSASADMRAEAGYKWGLSYTRRNEPDRAATIWWRDVVGEMLASPEAAARLGPSGRYWLARTLFDLSDLLTRLGRTDEARRALTLVVDSGVTDAYSELARARLRAAP